MDDWISVLKEECDRTSQSEVGRIIGYSPAVVNQVLKGTYAGNLDNVERKVRGALMGRTVECPVIGDIPLQRCMEHQTKPFKPTNSLRARLFRACKTCEHNKRKKGK